METEKGKKKSGRRMWERILHAFRTNYFLRLSVTMLFSLVFVSLLFLFYLQNQYLDYLAENATQTDTVLLGIEEGTISRNIGSIIQKSADMSLDNAIVGSAEALVKDPEDTLAKLTLRSELEMKFKENADELINVAITDLQGNILFQKSRVYGNIIVGNDYWSENNQDLVAGLIGDLSEQIDKKKVPRCAWTTEPEHFTFYTNRMPVYSCRNMLNLAFAVPGNSNSAEDASAVIIFSFELSSVKAFFSQITGMPNNYTDTFITGQDGKLLYAPDEAYIGKNLEDVAPASKFRTISRNIDGTDWNLNIVLDLERLNELINSRYRRGTLVLMAAILAISIIQFLLTRHALQPIRSIRKAMNSVKKGVWKTRIEVKGEDEIWKLAENYNEMADALEEWKEKNARQNAERLQSVRKTADAQMHALQSQINAHFLCNTLNAINMSAAEQGNEEVSEMLRKLSDIMRYAYSRSEDTVTLRDEVKWVTQYLALQKFRLMDRFDYVVSFPEEYLEWPCCKLFLQPFVENSIRHGFAEKEKGCFISVTGHIREDGRMSVVIEDNGCGMNDEQQAAVRKKLSDSALRMEGTGIGIENVTARLRIYYGDHMDIGFWSEEGKGTRFTLNLPIPRSILQEEDGEDTGE